MSRDANAAGIKRSVLAAALKNSASFLHPIAVSDMLGELQKDTQGFLRLAGLLKELTGIHLPPNTKNLSLMAGRLNAVFRRRGYRSYEEYFRELLRDDPELTTEFISALTTNTTQFFREDRHFELLSQLVPEIMKRNSQSKEVRVWCAACSTGQEAYTLALVVGDAMGIRPAHEMKMLASDIDLDVLEKASDGIYTEEEVDSLPAHQRRRWLREVEPDPEVKYLGTAFQMKDELRERIRFAQFNLQEPHWPFRHKFDVIFCRNVLIYFDKETCESIIEKMISSLAIGGYLFLGHSEAGMLRSKRIEAVASGVARRIA